MRMPIPIRGPLSIPLRLIGIKISQMNPNLCTLCETNFTKVKKKKQIVIPATILFADLRGYTSLSEKTEGMEVVHMLHSFYDECASAIWEKDGIVNKFLGDAVLAIFNFPIMREDHVRQAVLAGVEIQTRCMKKKNLTITTSEGKNVSIGIGIGIHTGNASIGEVGTAYKDFTIIGPVVNMASRIQAAAKLGEILVTEAVYHHVEDLFPQAEAYTYQLKGIEEPVNGYLLPAIKGTGSGPENSRPGVFGVDAKRS
jgi:adenylate cyclase